MADDWIKVLIGVFVGALLISNKRIVVKKKCRKDIKKSKSQEPVYPIY